MHSEESEVSVSDGAVDLTPEEQLDVKVNDMLYYQARATQRAAIEICIAVESCEVWNQVCGFYDKQQRDSTLSWGDFAWLVNHAYRHRVDTFRMAAYEERARGNTTSFISHKVGSAHFLTCLKHGPTYHFSSDGRCMKCEKDAERSNHYVWQWLSTAKNMGMTQNGNEADLLESKQQPSDDHLNSPEEVSTRMNSRMSNTAPTSTDTDNNRGPAMKEGDNMPIKRTQKSRREMQRPQSAKIRRSSLEIFDHAPADPVQDASDMIEVHEHNGLHPEEDDGGIPKVSVSQKRFHNPKPKLKRVNRQPFKSKLNNPVATKPRTMTRPQSAPMKRRSKVRGRPSSATRLRSSAQTGGGTVNSSLEAHNRAREITKMRIAALDGSGKGTHSVQSEIRRRQSRLREQLEKSQLKSRQRHREIESHLRTVRSAMEKEVRSLNNHREERRGESSDEIS